ncbi:ATP-grasp domain-containing protein [Methylomonas sp. 2BW1-5-20]|uniref:ATP-grasp domain-containing protein n=1 Tax=Methylomonas sp. 2BW1-5-20 TaxID=3376686 RepID=UPI0040518636
MRRRILTEASGSLVSGYLINAIKDAGHIAVASDIEEQCVGRYLADDFVRMPSKHDTDLWPKVSTILAEHRIDVVIPSLDETLLGWANNKHRFADRGVEVIVSDPPVIETFVDKWLAYLFFVDNGIPTPATSLGQDYPLVKPRHGRGGQGVRVVQERVDMTGMLSQALLEGEEYTVDVLCDKASRPLYIVPRRRIGVKDGKSTQGVVVRHEKIIEVVGALCEAAQFIGPINVQCFCCLDGTVKVIEVNPRIAGGMALGFAATENWISVLCDALTDDWVFQPKPIKYGLRMMRYYAEVFVSDH